MKPGDLVKEKAYARLNAGCPDYNLVVGLIIKVNERREKNGAPYINVLWSDGKTCYEYEDPIEVINETQK